MLQVGFLCGWTSPYLSRLINEDSHLQITKDEASWIGSLLNAGRFFGSFFGTAAVYFGGSRKALFFSFIPITVGWLLTLDVQNVGMLYASRSLCGIGIGMIFSCFPLYVGEVSLETTRGSMVMMGFLGSNSGIFLASVFGYYLTMRDSSIVFIAHCFIGMLIFLFLPDSAHRSMKRGDFEKAKKSINWYRSGDNVEVEFQSVQKFITSIKSKNFREKLLRFSNPPVRRALFVVMTLFAFMQLCGVNVVLFYMEIIFRSGQSHIIDPSRIVTVVYSFGIVTLILAMNLMDKFGRRVLLIVSSFGVMIAALGFGVHFTLLNSGRVDPKEMEYFPIIWTILYVCSNMLGLLVVPSAVLSEIFPANVKNTAACMASLTTGATAFFITKTYQPITDHFGEEYAFFMYASFAFLVTPFVLFFMPETKGKTLQEIQEELMI